MQKRLVNDSRFGSKAVHLFSARMSPFPSCGHSLRQDHPRWPLPGEQNGPCITRTAVDGLPKATGPASAKSRARARKFGRNTCLMVVALMFAAENGRLIDPIPRGK
jgi:hypothetical protein